MEGLEQNQLTVSSQGFSNLKLSYSVLFKSYYLIQVPLILMQNISNLSKFFKILEPKFNLELSCLKIAKLDLFNLGARSCPMDPKSCQLKILHQNSSKFERVIC